MPDGLVGQRPAAAHDANFPFLVNVARHNADLALFRGDDSRTVGANQHRFTLAYLLIDANHVQRRHTLGNGYDRLEPCIQRFQDSIGRKGRRDENHRGVCPGFLDGLFNGIEHGQSFNGLPTFARRHSANHLGAVIQAAVGVERACRAGDSLADHAGIFVDQNAHRIQISVSSLPDRIESGARRSSQ